MKTDREHGIDSRISHDEDGAMVYLIEPEKAAKSGCPTIVPHEAVAVRNPCITDPGEARTPSLMVDSLSRALRQCHCGAEWTGRRIQVGLSIRQHIIWRRN